MRASILSLAEQIRRFRDDKRGVSALEFALILPILLVLFFGTVEVSEGVTINRKVTQVTSTLSDLVTQSRQITNTEMTNILDASAAVMTPYPATTLKMVVSGVTIDGAGKATVTWSDARNRTALKPGDPVTLPANLAQKNTFLVMADVNYTYTPKIGYVVAGSLDLKDGFYVRPRISDTIARTN